MSIIAKQSTARTVIVGPILDADGVAVTDAVVGDLKISKNGGAPAALNGSATLTHRNTGHYSLALTTSDTDTVGQAEIVIDDTTNAMPVKAITIVEEVIYDALFAASATGLLPANMTQIAGQTASAAGTVTFPETIASTTNITAGTITTTTNLTNLPTMPTDWISSAGVSAAAVTKIQSGLATAAELAKVPKSDGTATWNATALASINAQCDTALADYDGPTNAEMVARTLVAADYALEATLTTMKGATFTESTDSLEALRNRGDAAWTTAVGFSTHSASDVWAVGTRVLTAGTNIALAKGTGVTGFNDLDAAGVRTAVGLGSANLDSQLGDLPTNPELAAAIITGLTTALTEGYRGTGATGSVRDILYEMLAVLVNRDIVGTTQTAYKLDKTTPAKTYTLDSDSAPTAIEETT